MGRQAMERNRGRKSGGSEESGPLPKARRRSLKLASQARKNEERPQRVREVSLRGRARKRQTTGRKHTSLVGPEGANLQAAWQ